jgi:hypothetical protein
MLRGIIPIAGGGALEARVTTLENVVNEYEIYYSVSSGTTGSVTIPTGSAIVAAQYGSANGIAVTTDASGRPTDNAAKTSGGSVITVTLTTSTGAYTLSGTPSAYPIAIVYQVSCLAKDAGNVPVASIIDWTVVHGTMANQNADAVAITGGTINGTSIGATTASTGRFTTVQAAGLIESTLNGFKFPDGTTQTTAAVSGATNLDSLSDVVITSAVNGQVLKYNGTNWINGADATGGGSSPTLITVNFGTGAGKSALRHTVSDAGITSTSRVEAWLHGSTTDHNEEEHQFIPMQIGATNKNAGVGFTMFLSSEYRLTGQLQVAYRIS